MQAYSELLPPTAVTHALKLPFLKSQAENLIVAKTSLLQIFETTPVLSTQPHVRSISHGHQAPNGDVASTKPQAKLVLIAEYSLSGTITSLARIKALNTKSGGEALLISFKNAKASLVEWDPTTFSISTISIHTYENEDLQRNSWVQELNQHPSFLTSDPSSRAAALKLGQRHIAVIPFRQLGDELAAGDFDPDLDAPAPSQPTASRQNGEPTPDQTPYGPSFVLSLTALDPNIVRPVDLAFLYEYREPTLGVVSATTSPSSSITEDRKDVLTYTVFTLDLEQEARTILLSVQNLPSDIFKLQPLPKPVGGALLVGGNEILHVDQAGKTHAVAVNEFARQVSSFPMVDQSSLGLKLEGCVIEQVNSKKGDMIMFLATGEIVHVSFRIDGRSVSRLSLQSVKQSSSGELMRTSVSCAVALDKDLMFIGSNSSDALLLRYCTQRTMLSRKRSHADMLGVEDERSDQDLNEGDAEDDDDDLYAGDTKMTNGHSVQQTENATDNFVFTIEDTLPNLSSTGEPCIAPDRTPQSEASGNNVQEDTPKVKIALATGRGEESRLTFISKHISLTMFKTLPFPGVQKTWCLGAVGAKEDSANGTYHTTDPKSQNYHQFMITTGISDDNASSRLYDLKSGNISEVKDSYFDNETTTLNAGLLCNGKRIVQVSQNEVRCLDSDLALSQILPMLDESTDSELSIVQTSFCDPYLLVVRSDASIVVFSPDDREDQLEELEHGEILSSRKWSSGCLYMPRSAQSSTLGFMLTVDGTLYVFQLPDLETPLYQVEAVNLMPPSLSPENLFRRAPNREKIVEILVADIGVDTLVFPVLVLRTADDNLTLYRPFQGSLAEQDIFINPALKWLKVADTSLTKTFGFGNENAGQELSQQILRIIPNLGDYRAIFVAGKTPRLIALEPSSMPKIVDLNDEPIDLSPIHTPECPQGAIFTTREGEAMFSQLPSNTRFGEGGLAVRRVEIGSRIECLCYHPASDLFILGINDPTPFKLPDDDDWHQEWAKDDHSFPPTGNVSKLKLFDPKTNSTIHEVTLDTDEIVMSVKHALLEVSEITHEQRPLIAVGTAVTKGEDLPSNGNIHVFDVVNVVPEPDRPETNRSLKEISKEEVKGAVTALSEIGREGLLLNAQGQKCMVRGLKEDNSMLPVAFLDVQCDIMALRIIKGTGLALIGDILKGIWLVAFMTDPFRMIIFAKNRTDMDIVASEFLPQKKQLFLLAADDDCNLNVLEFNPEDPKSLSGQRLLQRNVFYMGHFPVSMVKLPVLNDLPESTSMDGDTHMEDDHEVTTQDYNVLLTTESGAIATITPLDEPTYRRLAALQIYLTGLLDHPCGLNPRMYRAIDSESFGNRGILDGQLLKRWYTLSSQRKAEACTRVGADVWQIRADLEMIGGAGMDYL